MNSWNAEKIQTIHPTKLAQQNPPPAGAKTFGPRKRSANEPARLDRSDKKRRSPDQHHRAGAMAAKDQSDGPRQQSTTIGAPGQHRQILPASPTSINHQQRDYHADDDFPPAVIGVV